MTAKIHSSHNSKAASAWVICPLFLVLLAACKEKAAPPPPPPAVTVARPVQKQVTDYLEVPGNTQAILTVQLVARVAGYLEKVLFQDGQVVKKGDLLFLIQQNTYQANLQQAEGQVLLQMAQLEYAEREFVRYSNLFRHNATSQENVDNWRNQRDAALANLKVAEANRELARLNLDYTEVRAPFDGRVDRRVVDPGNLVGSGGNTVLTQLNQIDPIYVYFNVSDQDLARLFGEAHWTFGKAEAKRWPVFAGLTSETGYPHEGYVDFAAISLTPTTGTLLLRGVFSNPGGEILPGLYARVRVPVRRGPALLVPQEVVGSDQQGFYVLVVGETNVVKRVGVKTGTLADNLRVIQEGLTGKEWVVVKGLQKAIPGRRVTPEREGSPPPSPPQRRTGP